jgi:hypothetical protein
VVAEAGDGEITELVPLSAVNETTLPPRGWGLVPWSWRLTVIVDMLVPLAGRAVGLAVTDEFAADPVGAAKVTLAVCVMGIESEESLAENVTFSAVESVTVKVAMPLLLVVPVAGDGLMVACEPLEAVRVTVLPGTGTDGEPVSMRVTVIVDWFSPSAGTEPGEADTVETDGDTAWIVGAEPSPGFFPSSVPSPGLT